MEGEHIMGCVYMQQVRKHSSVATLLAVFTGSTLNNSTREVQTGEVRAATAAPFQASPSPSSPALTGKHQLLLRVGALLVHRRQRRQLGQLQLKGQHSWGGK